MAACAVYAWSLLTALGVFGAPVQDGGPASAASAYEYEYSNGHVTGGGQIPGGVTIAVNAKANAGGLTGHCNVVDRSTDDHVTCTSVTMVVVTGTHGTIFGAAEHDGVDTTYTIDVDDFAESGRGADQFSITTGTGFSRSGTLVAGNLQVRE